MKEYLIIGIILILTIALIYLASVKSEKRKIHILNSQNQSIEVNVEIADNPLTHMRGLMFRSHLPENEGMLFVFNDSNYRSFWMVNTSIPLDIIFISETGRIVDIQQMEPCRTIADYCKVYRSREKARYVLEVNRGFSERNGIRIGDRMVFER